MAKKVLLLGLGIVFLFSLSGCATTRRNDELLNQGLKNKVMALEAQLNEKDIEINNLREALAQSNETSGVKVSKASSEVKERPTAKQIQTALKNAGYYQGSIDGKTGKNTRQAIKEFQKANNLSADGRVGKKTWAVLKAYLDKKVK
ncbi:MAG: peptidoglycan-binding domain-containing protein [Candidatus Omnitrophica bacterium]|jgi:peptidoglycan hydrolase-like protein with peptidoglycan-binding domain|nr:peptidoglycan-binding domain-containing protein [Candidatus Omnitrophota bacterium]MDD5660410.1 peptidoglycan-binding domain-containing protein [Candidatus Omnitrophota bacterium]